MKNVITGRRVGSLIGCLALTGVFMVGAPAHADSGGPSAGLGEDGVVNASNTSRHVTVPSNGSEPREEPQENAQQVALPVEDGIHYVYERVCTANVGDYLDPATCVELDARCTGGEDGILIQWIQVNTNTNPPTETPTGRQDCLYSGEPPAPPTGDGGEPADEPVVVTLREFESQPILAAKIVSQPEHFGLKNAHSNLYAIAEEQQFTFEFQDAQIRLRAWPVSYEWSYGDGAGQTTTTGGRRLSVGAMNTETATSHVYTETGDYNVTLVTYFAGDYSVNGGPWQPIAGEAAVASEPHLMSIWTSETSLYADNCLENPEGAGC